MSHSALGVLLDIEAKASAKAGKLLPVLVAKVSPENGLL